MNAEQTQELVRRNLIRLLSIPGVHGVSVLDEQDPPVAQVRVSADTAQMRRAVAETLPDARLAFEVTEQARAF